MGMGKALLYLYHVNSNFKSFNYILFLLKKEKNNDTHTFINAFVF